MSFRLLVGLGNPGKQYEMTRHNIGFLVLDEMARRFGGEFKMETKLRGELASCLIGTHKVWLLKPTTYMNCSGESVQKVLNFYSIDSSELLVVTDDVAQPYGQMRLRPEGGAGGHNGLKDIQRHCGGPGFARLRCGVGDRSRGSLSDHVLGRFTSEEREELPLVIDRACAVTERLLKDEPIEEVMQDANKRNKEQEISE